MAARKAIDIPPTVDATAARINLRHLQAFSAVAAHGSVTRAAESLFRVASAITRAVAELEESLGTPLFERKARGMLLNAFGEAVRARAQRVEDEFAAACQELAPAEPVQRGANAARLDARTLMAAMFSGRRLAVFAGLSEMQNMPATARAFGITQPAVSTLVGELEARCGRELFVRSARGVTPTRAGLALAFRFKRALAELRSIDSDIAAIGGVVQGRVVVGALPLGRTLILPSAIAALVGQHPRLHVSTVESPYEALAAQLRSGDVDFILGALRPSGREADLTQEALFDDCISLIARAGHPLAGRAAIGFDDLRQAQWVLSRLGSPTRELLEQSFRESAQPAPVPTVETGDLAILRGLLFQSDMVTAISAHQLHYEIEAGTLAVLNLPLRKSDRKIGLTQRCGALASPGALALMAELRKVVDQSLPSH
ncbi:MULTISPECIES: LysR family transcriptional regulator [unclassified Variovorax]|uniref:LysR family transcriptional regulator n=1 Tax=unclassified Variovorax TaxID=663243 RepID=UPI001BD32942|nr:MULTISPECIES: LysR family transcriptional regulator [unclassified Variovorax]